MHLLTLIIYSAKRLVAAWRVLLGVWAPKRWDLSLTALSQYTTPIIPAENPWVQQAQEVVASSTTEEPPVAAVRKRKPPTRRIIRHVLRSRAEAAKSLATFFELLERGGDSKKIKASLHLAQVYGWVDQAPKAAEMVDGVQVGPEALGWRRAREVVLFLKRKGARVASLSHGIEGEWAALSSDGEMSPSPSDTRENTKNSPFVAPQKTS